MKNIFLQHWKKIVSLVLVVTILATNVPAGFISANVLVALNPDQPAPAAAPNAAAPDATVNACFDQNALQQAIQQSYQKVSQEDDQHRIAAADAAEGQVPQELTRDRSGYTPTAAEQARARQTLQALTNVMITQNDRSIQDQRVDWTIFDREQRLVLSTVNRDRMNQGKSPLTFGINPDQASITLNGSANGALQNITFTHVGDNIFEYTNERGTYRILITGSVKNLQQLSQVFDRIVADQPPQEIVEHNPDGSLRRLAPTNALILHDISYEDWVSSLASERANQELRDRGVRDRLSASYSSQSPEVQLRIRQLQLLQDDLAAFKLNIQDDKKASFSAWLRQSIAKHPILAGGLGLLPESVTGGAESNFQEQIGALVNRFIEYYLVPLPGQEKSRLQTLVEENPNLSLEDLLTWTNEDGTGKFIQDPGFSSFIREIFVGSFNYHYNDLRTETDLRKAQMSQLMRLTGTFFDDFNPAETDQGALERFVDTQTALPKRLLESAFGQRNFALAEDKLFDYLRDDIDEVIVNNCNGADQHESMRREAVEDVNNTLDKVQDFQYKDIEGVPYGQVYHMPLRDWLLVNEHDPMSADQFRQYTENAVAQHLLHLQRLCAVEHMLTIKDAQGLTTGGLQDPDKRRMFQLYVHVFDLNNEWLTLSKQTWNTVFDEAMIQVPTMILTAGAANFLLEAVISGVSRLTRVAIAAAEAYRIAGGVSRVINITGRVLTAIYRGETAVSSILSVAGRVTHTFAEGALQNLFDRTFSLDTLHELAGSKNVRSGEDWAKSLIHAGLFQGVFELSGNLTSKIFSRTVAFENIYGKERFEQVATWAGRLLEGHPAIGRIFQEQLQNASSVLTMLALNAIERKLSGENLSTPRGQSIAQDLLGDQAFQQELLQVFLQVYTFSYTRKIGIALTHDSSLSVLFSGHEGSERELAVADRVRTLEEDLQGLSRLIALEGQAIAPDAQRMAELRQVLLQLSIQKNQLVGGRLSQLREELQTLREQIGQEPQGTQHFSELSAREVEITTELQGYEKQRTVINDEQEYQDLVRQQTADGTIEVTDKYGHVDLATGRWYVNMARIKADMAALEAGARQMTPAQLAAQIVLLSDAQLARMVVLPADPAARQQALNDLRHQLEQNPAVVDQGRGADGQGASLRDLFVRNQRRNLLEGHVRHEMGHRFERALDDATRLGLANSLGFDLSKADQQEPFEETVADWIAGKLPAERMASIDQYFRDRIGTQNPKATPEQVESELQRIKKVQTIQENFNYSFQADAGVDFETGTAVRQTILPAFQKRLDAAKGSNTRTALVGTEIDLFSKLTSLFGDLNSFDLGSLTPEQLSFAREQARNILDVRKLLGVPATDIPSFESVLKTLTEEVKISLENRNNSTKLPYHQVSRPTDVTAIPDVHGDANALKRSLQGHGLVDAQGSWIGGNRVLVLLGDYIDRGQANLDVLDYMVQIKNDAESKGGQVRTIVGNHEAMMIKSLLGQDATGSWLRNGGLEVLRNISETYGKAYGLKGSNDAIALLKRMVLEPPDGSGVVGRYYELFQSMDPALQVDDILYVHAGVSPKWAENIRTSGVVEIQAQWRDALQRALTGDMSVFNTFNEAGGARNGKAEFGGLFWNDLNAEVSALSPDQISKIASDLKSQGINGIFVGHTVIKGELSFVQSFLDQGLLLMGLDVGISEAYAGKRGQNIGEGGVTISGDSSARPGVLDLLQNGKNIEIDPADALGLITKEPPTPQNVEQFLGTTNTISLSKSSLVLDRFSSPTIIVGQSEYRIFVALDLVGNPSNFSIIPVDRPAEFQRFSVDQEVTMGRDPKQANVVVNDPSVSRIHLKISMRGGDLVIEDLSSTGTKIEIDSLIIHEPFTTPTAAATPNEQGQVLSPDLANTPEQQAAVAALQADAARTSGEVNPEYLNAVLSNATTQVVFPDGATATLYRAGHIASGSFGSVSRAFYLTPDGRVVEVVLKEFLPEAITRGDAQHEIAFSKHLATLQSQGELTEGIIRVYGNSVDGRSIAYGLVKSPDGSVQTLSDYQFKSPQEVVTFLISLVKAMKALHDRRIFINDFKPDNVLVNEKGEAVIIDIGSWLYGISSRVGPELNYLTSEFAGRGSDAPFIFTDAYTPPQDGELLRSAEKGNNYTFGIDLYSLAQSIDVLTSGSLTYVQKLGKSERLRGDLKSNLGQVLEARPELKTLLATLIEKLRGRESNNFYPDITLEEVMRQLGAQLTTKPAAEVPPQTRAEQAQNADAADGTTVRQDQVQAEGALVQKLAESQIPKDVPGIFARILDYFTHQFRRFLGIRDAVQDLQEAQDATSARDTAFAQLPADLQDPATQVGILNDQNPTPETNRKGYVKVQDGIQYLQHVYDDLVQRGDINADEVSFDEFLSDNAETVGRELAFVSKDGNIVFNMEGIRLYMQATGRSFFSVVRELLTHENVHRTFNELPQKVRDATQGEVGGYYADLRGRFASKSLMSDEIKLLTELAKNLGVEVQPGENPVDKLFQAHPEGDSALVDEMIATYFGLNRVGELPLSSQLETKLARAGIDIENFYKLSHAREVYDGVGRYTEHQDATRRTEGGVVLESPDTALRSSITSLITQLTPVKGKLVSPLKQTLLRVLTVLKSYSDLPALGRPSFEDYLRKAGEASFYSDLKSLQGTATNVNARRVLNLLSDFIPTVTALDAGALKTITEGAAGRVLTVAEVARINTLAGGEANPLKKMWYEIQIGRLRQDVKSIADIFKAEEGLRAVSATFPADLFPELSAVVKGQVPVLDLFGPDGNPFTSFQALLDFVLPRLRAANSPVFLGDNEFSVYLSLTPEVRDNATKVAELEDLRVEMKHIRNYAQKNNVRVAVDDVLEILDATQAIRSGKLGTFYTSDVPNASGQYEGVLVSPDGKVQRGILQGNSFEPSLEAAPVSEAAPAPTETLAPTPPVPETPVEQGIAEQQRLKLIDVLKQRAGPQDAALVQAIEAKHAVDLPNGVRVYIGPELGGGGVAQVFRGVFLSADGQPVDVAVKKITNTGSPTGKYALRVASYVSTNDFPEGLAKIYGVSDDLIVSELIQTSDQGTVEVGDYQFASAQQADTFARSLVDFFQQLHDRGFVFSDIKDSNILIQEARDPVSNEILRYPDGTAFVIPKIADIDSLMARGKPEDYHDGDPRRDFTVQNSGLPGPLATALTTAGYKIVAETLEQGVKKREVTVFGVDPQLNRRLVEDPNQYEGLDPQALGWTMMYLLFGDNIADRAPGEKAISLGNRGNFSDILTPEQRVRYLQAIDTVTGLTRREKPDDLISGSPTITLSEFKALLTGEKNTETLAAGSSAKYAIAPGNQMTIFAGDTRVIITRDDAGNMIAENVATGERHPLPPGRRLTIGNVDLNFRTGGIFTSEGLTIINRADVNARVRVVPLPPRLQSFLDRTIARYVNALDWDRFVALAQQQSQATSFSWFAASILGNDSMNVSLMSEEQRLLADKIIADAWLQLMRDWQQADKKIVDMVFVVL